MNDYTPRSTDSEPEITSETAKKSFYWLIYNLRVSHPEAPILLALVDINACFRFPWICSNLTGAFGFLATNLYFLAIAMVFGSNTPAACWEPFRRAIGALSKKFADHPDLVEKHKEYTAELPMSYKLGPRWDGAITWSDFKSDAIFGFLSPNYTGHDT